MRDTIAVVEMCKLSNPSSKSDLTGTHIRIDAFPVRDTMHSRMEWRARLGKEAWDSELIAMLEKIPKLKSLKKLLKNN